MVTVTHRNPQTRTAAVSQSQQLFQQGAGPCQFRQDHSQIVFAAAGGGQTHGAVRHLHGTILCAMVLGVGDLGGPGKLSKPKYHWKPPNKNLERTAGLVEMFWVKEVDRVPKR